MPKLIDHSLIKLKSKIEILNLIRQQVHNICF